MGEESEAVLKGEITGSWMQSSGTRREPTPEWQAGENVLWKMERSHVATSRGEITSPPGILNVLYGNSCPWVVPIPNLRTMLHNSCAPYVSAVSEVRWGLFQRQWFSYRSLLQTKVFNSVAAGFNCYTYHGCILEKLLRVS